MLDLEELALRGKTDEIHLGLDVSEVVALLGQPELWEAQKRSYPEILKYGDIEMRCRDRLLNAVSVGLWPGRPVDGYAFEVTGFWPEDKRLAERIGEFFQDNGVSWASDPIMSEPGAPVWVTKAGVHLAFRGDHLSRFGIAAAVG